MDRKLFYLQGGRVVKMPEHSYEQEADLQKLIADNPDLVGRAWDDNDDNHIILISREQKSQVSEDDGNSFSLDLLMVDSESVPILVEVKRSTDTRIRREVVAQMLDYACRASAWSVDDLKEKFRKNNSEPYPDCIDDMFWSNVAANLKARHFRLVFAADEIPDTLRILIEFLDLSMSNIDVYGVEIRQFKTSDTTMISSSIIGNSINDPRKPASDMRPSPRTLTRAEFIDLLEQRDLSSLRSLVCNIMDYADEQCGTVWVSAYAWKYLAQHAIYQDKRLFSIEISSRARTGHYCAAVFDLVNLSMYLGKDWNSSRLRNEILSFPSYSWAKERNLIWGDSDKNKWLYIDLRALQDEACVDQFKKTLKTLAIEMRTNEGLNL